VFPTVPIKPSRISMPHSLARAINPNTIEAERADATPLPLFSLRDG